MSSHLLDAQVFLSTKSVYLLAGCILLFAVLSRYLTSKSPATQASKAGATLPPGPPQRFAQGSIASYPRLRWFETFSAWQKQYGDITYLNLVGKPVMILNSLYAAEELMVKRMNLSSKRPYRTMISEVMSAGWALIVIQPDHSFREQRKLFHKALGPHAVGEYDSIIQNECETFVQNLSNVSGDPFPVIIRAVGAIIIKAGYGERVYREYGEELVKVNRTRSVMLTSVLQKFWLVDVFPFLKHVPSWFPGANFRRIGDSGTKLAKKVRYWAYDLVQQNMIAGKGDDSIISRNIDRPGCSNEDLRDAVASMYAAGADTTATAIINFFYALLLHPEVQTKIQEELDTNTGEGSILSIEDVQNLPYFNAAWKESMRWNTPVPLGIPHVYESADVWNGYYIPKDTMFQCNIGFMLRDPRIWGPDADSFNPKRFLPEHNPRAKELPDMMSLPFGFGKRICPGRYLADRVGKQFAAAALKAYNIVPLEGEPIPSSIPFDDSTIRRPTNFRCQFATRHS